MHATPDVPPRLPGPSGPSVWPARWRWLVGWSVFGLGLRFLNTWLAAGGWLPSCPFRTLTGLPCPTCGTTHALMALSEGRWQEAWLMQPLVITSLFLVFVWTTLQVWWPAGAARWRQRIFRRPAGWILGGALLVLTVFHYLLRLE